MLSGEVRRRNECENDCAIHNKERRRSHFSSFGAFYLLAAAAAAVATVAVAIKSTDNLYLCEQVFCDERRGRALIARTTSTQLDIQNMVGLRVSQSGFWRVPKSGAECQMHCVRFTCACV